MEELARLAAIRDMAQLELENVLYYLASLSKVVKVAPTEEPVGRYA